VSVGEALPLAEQPGEAAADAALEPVAAASEEPAMPVSQATTVPSVAEPAPDPVAVLAALGQPATATELMPTEESMIAMGVAQLDLSAAGTFTPEEPAAAQVRRRLARSPTMRTCFAWCAGMSQRRTFWYRVAIGVCASDAAR
jgi:hypothetical protein